jgi:hypothetical protein
MILVEGRLHENVEGSMILLHVLGKCMVPDFNLVRFASPPFCVRLVKSSYIGRSSVLSGNCVVRLK